MKLTPNMKGTEVTAGWYVVDAQDIPLGRLATAIATRLRGKHKATYTPHVDTGDHIIVINAKNVRLTGHKLHNMQYHYHTGFIGGIKTIFAKQELEGKHPERLVERAVERMMPKDSPLSRAMFKKLHVYAGTEHPHAAQSPKQLKLGKKEGVR
ncbi:MAG: 50S ribosomal protein L13 [Proteobacteria bacterium]|nr:50S ribosomal protein L13 [Pseudomonadota bacterium]